MPKTRFPGEWEVRRRLGKAGVAAALEGYCVYGWQRPEMEERSDQRTLFGFCAGCQLKILFPVDLSDMPEKWRPWKEAAAEEQFFDRLNAECPHAKREIEGPDVQE